MGLKGLYLMNEELSVLAKISSKPLEELSKEEMARLIIREKRALLQLASDTLDIFLGISYNLEYLKKTTVSRITDTFFIPDKADIAANVAREVGLEEILTKKLEENKKRLSTMEEKLSELESEVKELLIGNRRALNALTGDNVDDNL